MEERSEPFGVADTSRPLLMSSASAKTEFRRYHGIMKCAVVLQNIVDIESGKMEKVKMVAGGGELV